MLQSLGYTRKKLQQMAIEASKYKQAIFVQRIAGLDANKMAFLDEFGSNNMNTLRTHGRGKGARVRGKGYKLKGRKFSSIGEQPVDRCALTRSVVQLQSACKAC